MDANRVRRLKHLLHIQEQLKALHEAHQAGHQSRAGEARAEAEALMTAAGSDALMPRLFPELYHRRIEEAVEREAGHRRKATAAAAEARTARARLGIVEDAYREASQIVDRHREEVERLELPQMRPRR
jgi:hypothetical protein